MVVLVWYDMKMPAANKVGTYIIRHYYGVGDAKGN